MRLEDLGALCKEYGADARVIDIINLLADYSGKEFRTCTGCATTIQAKGAFHTPKTGYLCWYCAMFYLEGSTKKRGNDATIYCI